MPALIDEIVDVENTVLASHDAELLRVLAESSMARYVVEVQAIQTHAPEEGPQLDSTQVLCEAMRKTGGSVISIVPGGSPDAERLARAQVVSVASRLDEAGVRQEARFLTGDALAQLAALTGPIDLLFLAGQIDYAAALEAAMANLRPGSLVVAHKARTDKAFLQAIHADTDFETTVLDHGAGLSVSLRRR